jgi:hypothetical protein
MGRMRAGQLAPTDTAKALDAARACPDAWYRVQALASVAQHTDQRIALRILEEAAREARSCHDAYGVVAVMAWPLGVAFKQGQFGFASASSKTALRSLLRSSPAHRRPTRLKFSGPPASQWTPATPSRYGAQSLGFAIQTTAGVPPGSICTLQKSRTVKVPAPPPR